MLYLNVAGCGGVTGGAGEGSVGDGDVLEGRKSALVSLVVSSLFTVLELQPELCNLLASNRRVKHKRRETEDRDKYLTGRQTRESIKSI